MTDTNKPVVLKFPAKSSENADAPSLEKIQEGIKEYRKELHFEVAEVITQEIIMILEHLDFNPISDPKLIKESCFMMEAIRSLIAKKYGVEHPFHDFSEKMFDVKENTAFFKSADFNLVEKENSSS